MLAAVAILVAPRRARIPEGASRGECRERGESPLVVVDNAFTRGRYLQSFGRTVQVHLRSRSSITDEMCFAFHRASKESRIPDVTDGVIYECSTGEDDVVSSVAYSRRRRCLELERIMSRRTRRTRSAEHIGINHIFSHLSR